MGKVQSGKWKVELEIVSSREINSPPRSTCLCGILVDAVYMDGYKKTGVGKVPRYRRYKERPREILY